MNLNRPVLNALILSAQLVLGLPITLSSVVAESAWQTPTLIASKLGNNFPRAPSVAADPSGNVIAVWEQDSGTANSRVWASRFETGKGWGASVSIATTKTEYAGMPSIAVDTHGNAIAAWVQGVADDSVVWVNRFTPKDGWGISSPIETDTQSRAITPQIGIDGRGNAVVVWNEAQDQYRVQWKVWASRFITNDGWGPPREIDDGSNPVVAIDAGGDGLAVWQKPEGIWANSFSVTSGWGNPLMLEKPLTGRGQAQVPQVVVDPSGNGLAVWEQGNGTSSNIWSNRFDSDRGWGTPEIIQSSNERVAHEPAISMDQDGNVMAVWIQTNDTFVGGSNFHVWTNRFIKASGWGIATPVPTGTHDCNEAGPLSGAMHPQPAIDHNGDATVVWVQCIREPEQDRDHVWANSYAALGGWGTPTPLDTGVSSDFPRITGDDSGNVAAVWLQIDGTSESNYRIDIWARQFIMAPRAVSTLMTPVQLAASLGLSVLVLVLFALLFVKWRRKRAAMGCTTLASVRGTMLMAARQPHPQAPRFPTDGRALR